MRRAHLAALLIAVALPVQASAGPNVTTNSASGVNIGAYPTYSWVDTKMRMPSGMDPVTYQRIQSNIEAALNQKGYQRGNPGALTLVLTVGARDYADSDWYYGSDWKYTEGQLSIDVFDTKTRQALFHGQAIGTVDRKKPRPEKADAAVAEIMESFPAYVPPPPPPQP